jgi:hypothetical protein
MVKKVIDLTLTKPRSLRAMTKRVKPLWLGIAVIGLLLTASLLWPDLP